jgi:hypothetical protein
MSQCRIAGVAQQGDVAQRRVAIDLVAVRNVSDGANTPALAVLGLDPRMSVTKARHTLSRIKAHEIAPPDAIKHTPHLGRWICAQIGRRRPAFWATVEVEPQAITADPPRPPFEGAHASSFQERAVMHVGAEREIPDFIPRTPFEPDPAEPVVAPR